MDKTSNRINVDNSDFSLWKSEVLKQVDAKIGSLKKKVKYQKVSSVLKRKDVIDCLSEIHTNFVVVPIDKAANNVAFICKRFYVEVILKEIGILGVGNETYVRIDRDKDEIVSDNLRSSLYLLDPEETQEPYR